MAGKPLIGDDNSINSFDGKTEQIHGQVATRGVEGDGNLFSSQEIAPQIPFSRCVPGPLSLRQRVQIRTKTNVDDTTYYARGGGDDTQIGTSPAYSVTKDNTGN